MALAKLKLDPDAASYSVQIGDRAISVAVSQGPARRRREHLGSVSIVDVQWVLEAPQYQYLTAFRRTTLADATLPFLMDMIIDGADIAEYRCAFVIGSYALSGVRGTAYIVKAQVEARPNAFDPTVDVGFVDIYDAYGMDGPDYLNQFAILLNIELPRAIS